MRLLIDVLKLPKILGEVLEIENPIKKRVRKHVLLYRLFKLPSEVIIFSLNCEVECHSVIKLRGTKIKADNLVLIFISFPSMNTQVIRYENQFNYEFEIYFNFNYNEH